MARREPAGEVAHVAADEVLLDEGVAPAGPGQRVPAETEHHEGGDAGRRAELESADAGRAARGGRARTPPRTAPAPPAPWRSRRGRAGPARRWRDDGCRSSTSARHSRAPATRSSTSSVSGRATRACAKSERRGGEERCRRRGPPRVRAAGCRTRPSTRWFAAAASTDGSRTAVSEKPAERARDRGEPVRQGRLVGQQLALKRGQSQWPASTSCTMPTSRASSSPTMATSPRPWRASRSQARARSIPRTPGLAEPCARRQPRTSKSIHPAAPVPRHVTATSRTRAPAGSVMRPRDQRVDARRARPRSRPRRCRRRGCEPSRRRRAGAPRAASSRDTTPPGRARGSRDARDRPSGAAPARGRRPRRGARCRASRPCASFEPASSPTTT